MKILSILIPTTPDRNEMFTELYNELNKQLEYMQTFHPSLGEIEILVDSSKRFLDGGLSIGKKREALVQRAEGMYLCFLDSDEQIAGNYLETLVRLCQRNTDVVTFRSLANLDSYWCVVDMSRHNVFNQETHPEKIVNRLPWHICPVKSHIAKIHPFKDSNYGEDWEWMDKVLRSCTSEAKTNAVIHMYKHRAAISEADKITQHEIQSIK
jgi:glycosyl transferase family 2